MRDILKETTRKRDPKINQEKISASDIFDNVKTIGYVSSVRIQASEDW